MYEPLTPMNSSSNNNSNNNSMDEEEQAGLSLGSDTLTNHTPPCQKICVTLFVLLLLLGLFVVAATWPYEDEFNAL
eukprot:m.5434 g.5434  ORF g.5434 m.5434 type:complete len:76 (-) comp4240_c0_seq1:275-502(-)